MLTSITEGRHSLALSEFVSLFNEGRLILDPAFQRSHAWKTATREQLVEAVLQGRTIPEILLFQPNGSDSLIVIDGKQRLETLLSFLGTLRAPGIPEVQVKHGEERGTLAALAEHFPDIQEQLLSYRLGVVVCVGDVADAVTLFRAWNTSSGLTPAEIRNAEHYGNPLYREIKALSAAVSSDLSALRVVSEGYADRMQKEEIITELMCQVYSQQCTPSNLVTLHGKAGVEKVLSDAAEASEAAVPAARAHVEKTIRFMAKWFTSIPQSRFRYRAAFFSLFSWTEAALRAGYGPTISSDKALVINGAISGMSADLTGAARKSAEEPTLFSTDELGQVLSSLRAASDSRTARERRLAAISSALSRALSSLIDMDQFPSVEEMISESTLRKERLPQCCAA